MYSFTHDIFISYRHLDNKAPSGTPGWIDDFTERLRLQLGYNLGREPVIWRDPVIRPSEFFEDVIMKHLAQSKILISILSPGYIDPDSPWCMRELSEFSRLAEQNLGLRVGDTSRRVKIVKTFLPREKHPPELQGLLGYEFFEEDVDAAGRRREFSYLPEGRQHDRYLDRIDQLAWDLSELLKAIDSAKAETKLAQPPPDAERIVYLAETTPDRAQNRDSIKSELVSRGYYILPDKELPETADEYREAVREDLKRARLSIHLIGERYGNTLVGESEKSVAYMQNEIAAQRSCEDTDFSRVIWIPPGLVPSGQYQTKFVGALKTDAEAQKGAEVLERSFEELKNRIIEKLTTPKPVASKLLKFPQEDLVRIYLMCDKPDFDAVKLIRDYLFEKSYEVILSAREGDETQVIKYHKENLLECDAALIYYGHGNEFWLHSKMSDLRKVAGWGREKALLCKALYKAAPETEPKQDYKTREVVMLIPPGYQALSSEALEQFISYIESARAELAQTGSGGAR